MQLVFCCACGLQRWLEAKQIECAAPDVGCCGEQGEGLSPAEVDGISPAAPARAVRDIGGAERNGRGLGDADECRIRRARRPDVRLSQGFSLMIRAMRRTRDTSSCSPGHKLLRPAHH